MYIYICSSILEPTGRATRWGGVPRWDVYFPRDLLPNHKSANHETNTFTMLSTGLFRSTSARASSVLRAQNVRFASHVSADPRDNKFTSKNPKDWPEEGLVGPYPNLPYEYYNERRQDVKWDDKQGRRNLGEPLHHQFDLIDVWSPDHFDRLPDSKAYKYNGIFLGIIGVFSFWCWYTLEEPQFVRRQYPFDGLNKALGGSEETKEIFQARSDDKY